jgi:heme/copper-type cytochrome/quinol oxidase subunit 1
MTALRRYGVAAAGAALLAIGIVLVTTQPMSFGWTAYAPLTDVTVTPPFPTPAMWIGGALAAVGLALLAGWVGVRLGQRSRHPADS